MNAIHKLTLALALLAIPACGGSSTPSASMAKEYFEAQIAENAAGMMRLVSFEKTDAQSGEMFGVPMYALEFVGELEFLVAGKWLGGGNFSGFEFSDFMGDPVAVGDKRKIAGGVEFAKKEGGWSAERVDFEAVK